MAYTAPLDDIVFTLTSVADFPRVAEMVCSGTLDDGTLSVLLEQAGAFASDILAPLNRSGDRAGAVFGDGVVRMPAGFVSAYRQWVDAGWNAVSAPPEWGGSGLPLTLNACVLEMHTSACMAFGLSPVLTQAAADLLRAHGSDGLREAYLPQLVSGAWTATMALTEPQAGSDLRLLRTKAVPQEGDGTFRIIGQKIFITYGEHDLTDNIVHMVLARLPDAPEGTKGLSLFLVPKVLPDGRRNDVDCIGIEHKMGLHASPTCTLVFGERDGAVGWLVGEPHQGLAAMFTMMNRARLLTGIQGVAIAERSFQKALAFACERRQGKGPGGPGAAAIIDHPDVQRMLMTMRVLTAAARGIAYTTASVIDRAEHGDANAGELAGILTPVTKAFCAEAGIDAASLGIQIHGGMGYVEETGAAQYLRDVRVTSIYEGTNGIQAIDLVTRKIGRNQGLVLAAVTVEWGDLAESALGADDPHLRALAERLKSALGSLRQATEWILSGERDEVERLGAATAYLRLLGVTMGGAVLIRGARAAVVRNRAGEHGPVFSRAIANARFYADHVLIGAPALCHTVLGGSDSLALAKETLT